MTAACLLCGADSPFLEMAGSRPFHACPVCGLAFVPAAWHGSPEAELARYRLHRNRPDDAGYVRFLTTAIDALERHVPFEKAPRILDYGCGPTPVLAGLLRERGCRVSGYDCFFAPDFDEQARFDAVVSTEAIEHFRSPAGDLDRMVRSLEPGGVIVVLTSLRDAVRELGRWHYALDETHIGLYALRTFAWMATRWPVAVIETNPRNLVVLRRRS